MGNQEYGTGLVTSYKQLVSDRLGIGCADRIDVVYGESSDCSPRKLDGRRATSKLPALLDYALTRPIVSAGMIAQELGITPRAAQDLVAALGLREGDRTKTLSGMGGSRRARVSAVLRRAADAGSPARSSSGRERGRPF